MRDGASDDELIDIIGSVWSNRRDRYSELRSVNTQASQHHLTNKKSKCSA